MDIPPLSENTGFIRFLMEKKSLPMVKPETQDEEKLLDACREFESLFVNQLLKEMRKTVGKDGILPESHERSIYQGMFDEEVAKQVAQKGSLGLAEMLFQQLQQRDNSPKPHLPGNETDGKFYIKLDGNR